MKNSKVAFILLLSGFPGSYVNAQLKPDTLRFEQFTWKSEALADCTFEQSKELTGIKFLGLKSGFHVGDTWYPTWADDGKLYSPWTDGGCIRLDGSWEGSNSGDDDHVTTGQVEAPEKPLK